MPFLPHGWTRLCLEGIKKENLITIEYAIMPKLFIMFVRGVRN